MQFLTEATAVEKIRLSPSTFRTVYRRFGLKRYNLNGGRLDLKGNALKNCWRFLESEVDRLIRRIVNKTDKQIIDIDELYD